MKNMSARQTAIQIIYKINEDNAFSNVAMEKELSKNLLNDRRDAALVTELVNGTIKNRIYLDHIIQQFSKEKLSKLSPWVRNILRMSAYQLLFLDKIPESAAVNEGVNLTKKYSHQGSVKFVNAVLRNIIRKKDEIKFPDKKKNYIEYLSVEYSFPKWLVEFFIKNHGEEDTEKMLKFFNKVPDTWIRANRLKRNFEEIEKKFLEKEITLEKSKFVPEGYKPNAGANVMRMDEYKEGFFSVQDETSMIAVDIMDPQPGEKNIDVCSAPGGKTVFIAERMQNQGSIKGIEFYDHRLKIVENYSKRNGITIADLEVGDARDLHEKYHEEFDRAIADVPCSGLGVLGKRPDLKYQANACQFDDLVQVQKEILESTGKIIKKGGILLYSTCTLNKEENQEIIKDFLLKNENFERAEIPEKYKEFMDAEGNLQITPFKDNMNGFFISKLRKRGL